MLSAVEIGSIFYFGAQEFVKLDNAEALVYCQIKDKPAYVYISAIATVDISIKDVVKHADEIAKQCGFLSLSELLTSNEHPERKRKVIYQMFD